MKTIDTSMRYAVIHDIGDSRVFDVYVDGSFGSDFLTGGKHASSPYGSGWSLVHEKNGEQTLAGYGVAQFWDTYSSSSEVSELRSIVKFFEGLEEHCPDMLSRDFTYRIICDNQTLIRIITKALKNKDTSRSAYFKYGTDYADLVYFFMRTNINFEWVKGHSSNKFNRLADRMARRAYRTACSEDPFVGLTRYCFVTELVVENISLDREMVEQMKSDLFTARKELHADKIKEGQKSKGGGQRWKNGEAIHVSGAMAIQNNQYHVGTAYTLDNGTTVSTELEVFSRGEMEPTAGKLRMFQNAIFAYRTAETTDLRKPLTIHTNIKAIPPILNALRKGNTPSVSSNPHMTREINNLRMLLEGMEVRATYHAGVPVSQLTALATELANGSARGDDLSTPSFQRRMGFHERRILDALS